MSPCDLEDFDWVSARAQCEPYKVFQCLRAKVKEDTEKRNSLPNDGSSLVIFSFEEGNDWITASKKILGRYEGVTFTLTPNGITARDLSRNFAHIGILTLSDDGRCMIKVDSNSKDRPSKELTLWQFRKLALQDLFFIVEGRP